MYALCAHTSVYRPEARGLPQFLFILSFETVSGTKQRAHPWLTLAAQRTLEIFLSPPLPPALRLQTCEQEDPDMGTGDLKSGSQAWVMVGTVPIKLFPQTLGGDFGC